MVNDGQGGPTMRSGSNTSAPSPKYPAHVSPSRVSSTEGSTTRPGDAPGKRSPTQGAVGRRADSPTNVSGRARKDGSENLAGMPPLQMGGAGKKGGKRGSVVEPPPRKGMRGLHSLDGDDMENEESSFEDAVAMRMKDEGHGGQSTSDPRLVWLETRTRIAMGMSVVDAIKRLFTNVDAIATCTSFLDSDNVRLLFLYSDFPGEFTVSHSVPNSIKSRGVYFLKAVATKVTMETIDGLVMANDLHTSPLEQLNALSQEVFFPLIANTENQEGWPEVISKEITDNFYRFLANTYITIGRSIGKTLLPLPPTETAAYTKNSVQQVANQPKDKDSVHVLENAVVTWTRQIKNVLKQEPEGLLKGDLNPGPGAELEFWKSKADNLNSIHTQLSSEKIRKVMSILEVTKSTYYPAFDRLCKEVAHARSEANDNLIYLEPSDRYFSQLLSEDFDKLGEVFKPIMHVTLLIWEHSQFYNTPARLVVLIREFCNDIIRQACRYMGGVGIADAEPKEAAAKLKVIIGTCLDFKESYFLFKKASTVEVPDNPWRFQSSALFTRLDSFLERCHDVLDLMQTLTQFLTLYKIEIGGTKGKTLTSSVQQIFLDFQVSILVFKQADYDVMNVDSKQFEEHFYNFRLEVSELERRVASVIVQAFEDSTTILGKFKLLDSFEGLLERDILHSELEKKHEDLLHDYLTDLSLVQEIFLIGKPEPHVNDNAPPHAGAVAWVRGLLQRVDDPMKRLKMMGKMIIDSEGGRECERAYAIVVRMLQDYENEHIQQWARDVANTSEAKLKLSLLRREESSKLPLLHVNFDPALVCLLREVKYFLSLGVTVPEAALAIYRNEEVFRVQTGNLDLIVNLYNHILRTLLDVERPLVQQKMSNIDKVLQKGLKHMNWKSHTIGDFITQCMTIVKEVHTIVAAIKSDVAETQRILESWSAAPLMHRKQIRTYLPEEFTELQRGLIAERCADICRGAEEIHKNLTSSQKILRANRGSAHFKAYVDYVNEVIITGLSKASMASCQYLLRQVDPEYLLAHDVNPMLEIQLKLAPPDIVFSPPLGRDGARTGVRDMVLGWVASFCNIGMLVRRVDTPSGDGDYLGDVQEDLDVKFTIAQIKALIGDNEEQCEELRASFLDYDYLWHMDINESFQDFIRKERSLGGGLPPLILFEARINSYRELEEEIRELPGTRVIGWLKVDVRPLRNSLLTCVSKWRDVYQQYLIDYITHTMNDLLNYIEVQGTGLETTVVDSTTLELVLGHLRDIRKREDTTDASFEPLRAIIMMLSKYGVPIPEEVPRDLDLAADQWDALKRRALNVKEEHQSLQAKEAIALKTRGKAFEARVAEFRETFEKVMPFQFSENYNGAYTMIDGMHHGKLEASNVVSLVQEAERLNVLQDSYELEVVMYTDVMVVARECWLLKCLWDAISLVSVTYNEWRQTKWINCDVPSMIQANTILDAFLASLDPQIQNWPAWVGVMEVVDNNTIALPLVLQLQHNAMRSRHWKQLMRLTGVSFTIDEKFLVGDLLSLQLHNYEEEVRDLVDRAEKELLIEIQLKDLEETWGVQMLQFSEQKDLIQKGVGDEKDTEGLLSVTVSADLLEVLNDNILQLQTLQGSKYVQLNNVFLDSVSKWQHKLGLVDNTLTSILELQTKWASLHIIFIGSASMQESLPDDAARFNKVDEEWRAMMSEASGDPHVLRACTKTGRLERIETMLLMLDQCEKALSGHIEGKRKLCPRFYLMSPSDMLDILSKGQHPTMIKRHLRSCFDSVAELEFKPLDAEEMGEPRITTGMMSPEGEIVPFHVEFECRGEVELWFRDLVRHTHKAVELVIVEALKAVNGSPRIEFIAKWPAQAVSTALAVVMTMDVEMSFDAMQEGHENALRDFGEKLQAGLDRLVHALGGEMSWGLRRKVASVLTVEVHNRDLVGLMVEERVESSDAFQWQSQLRFTLHHVDGAGLARVKLCDYAMDYGCEYVGNFEGLVLTPLTLRCFVTLTQALKLSLGGAPTGQPGAGKTETIKALGKALGIMVFVFNCSDQMDHNSLHNIFRALASAGAWGAFQEFNRIDVAVLSVVSSQLKCILDAVRLSKETVMFEGEELELSREPCMGAFVTMNVGLQGRTSLPESARVLFRPCAMNQPDVAAICEILLLSQGYVFAKKLAQKVMTLFHLCHRLLSSQYHYDWGLRSIKTIIGCAGELRREEAAKGVPRGQKEEETLHEVVSSYCIARLADVDVPVFTGLMQELFPETALGAAGPEKFEAFMGQAEEAAIGQGLQAPKAFLSKMMQLRESLQMRCAVFVLGPAGCGKTECIRTLCRFNNQAKERTTSVAMNPKSVTRSELFGYLGKSGEWMDGMLSQVFRDMSTTPNTQHQYLVLDGDVDAEWVESINTVMDDNGTLTLASNERLALTPSMRVLFETSSLEHASPATVSRGGVTFMGDQDVGWRCFVQTWVQARETEIERTMILDLVDKYVPPTLAFCQSQTSHIVPLPEINLVQSMCYLLDSVLDVNEGGPAQALSIKGGPGEHYPKALEGKVVYCCVWGIGGALPNEKRSNYADQFDRFWRERFTDVEFPEGGTVFDYFHDTSVLEFVNWRTKVASSTVLATGHFTNLFVATGQSMKYSHIASLLVHQRRAVMFAGAAGTGKSSMIRDRLHALDPEVFSLREIHLNTRTDSRMLQSAMEGGLEKRSGKMYGPPGAKKLVYLLDDVNMPDADRYGTQQALALLRQQLGYNVWYDRSRRCLCDVHDVQFVACANPSAGGGHMAPRFQRTFCTFAVDTPSQDTLMHIFQSIYVAHFTTFDQAVQRLAADPLVRATLNMHNSVMQTFAPTASNFHYTFNPLRDISAVAQGVCRSLRPYYSTPAAIIRLWLHESERVYADRLVTSSEREHFRKICSDITLKWFDEHCEVGKIMVRPLIFTTFSTTTTEVSDRPYCAVTDSSKLSKIIEDKLSEYNESNPAMHLVMFREAVEHVCRITRVFDLAMGNMLLVGVGGSGKQSLAMLAAHICGHEHHSIVVTPTYTHSEFLAFLKTLYMRAGLDGTDIVLTLTDTQMTDELFLVAINDFICRSDVGDLFTLEEKDEIHQKVRALVKQAGRLDTRENCWDFFMEFVRTRMHLCLCFSPVGGSLRAHVKRFPSLLSCTTMDYFHPWPHDALVAVATNFLAPSGLSGESLDAVAQHMSYVQATVNQASSEYLEVERRYNYTTPKTFLDLIELYKAMLGEKRQDVRSLRARLESGLYKMENAAEQVVTLQARLVLEEEVVQEMTESANSVLEKVSAETARADAEKEAASGDEEQCARIAATVAKYKAEVADELKAAEPMLAEAEAALATLDKKNMSELKSLASPPTGVEDVTAAVMVLLGKGHIPKDLTFSAAKKRMANPENFLKELVAFEKSQVNEASVAFCEKYYTSKDSFNPDRMRSKSVAAAGMCAWVGNVCKYMRMLQMVEPKRALLTEATEHLDQVNHQLSGVRGGIKELEDRLTVLTEQFQAATKKKGDAQAQADRTMQRAQTAKRLVEGLTLERTRWEENLAAQTSCEECLVGDTLVASTFVSYIGAFNARLRNWLIGDNWVPDMAERRIPMTLGGGPMDLLTHPAQLAAWCNLGLPADEVSLQNGAIVVNSLRWPLLIDPQMQGVRWATARSEEGGASVTVVQMHEVAYLGKIEQAMVAGGTVLIQNMGETIDAMLHPVLSRSVVRKGTARLIRVGDREIEFDPSFRLLLHTKLGNPHYLPEISAQTTIVNFETTREGFGEQLLRVVVGMERPELDKEGTELIARQNTFKIQLKRLEDQILERLSGAEGDLLGDTDLVDGLEATKVASREMEMHRDEAVQAERAVSEALSAFRPVSQRASLLYSLLDGMWKLSHLYRYSVSHFLEMFKRGIVQAEETRAMLEGDSKTLVRPPTAERVPSSRDADVAAGAHVNTAGRPGTSPAVDRDLDQRVHDLVESTSLHCFRAAADGLFERHKLVLAAELCFRAEAEAGKLEPALYEALVRGARPSAPENPLREWLPDDGWGAVLLLEDIEVSQIEGAVDSESSNPFDGLASDMVEASKRFREWYDLEKPEEAPLPGRWRKVPDFHRVLITRALRPDRSAFAIAGFVRGHLGARYVGSQRRSLEEVSAEIQSRTTPILFLLSPGSDPTQEIETLAGAVDEELSIVSLGTGQEGAAARVLDKHESEGGWAMLRNIHLTPEWTESELALRVDALAESHPRFRLFLSSEPSNKLPISILQTCSTISSEEPEGLVSNLQQAMKPFTDSFFESCSRPADLQQVVTCLCLFHAAAVARKAYGTAGWNNAYPFTKEDLLCSANIAKSRLDDSSGEPPWNEIRYMTSDILYGGHITDDQDRVLARTLVETLLLEDNSHVGAELIPGLSAPEWGLKAGELTEYVASSGLKESPATIWMHPNVEVGVRLTQDAELIEGILELYDGTRRPQAGASVQERASIVVDDILERLPPQVQVSQARLGMEDRGKYIHVFLQEIERSKLLTGIIKSSLIELGSCLKGDIQASEATDTMMLSIANNKVPSMWEKAAYPSLLPLGAWVSNLSDRVHQLLEWSNDFQLPKVTWLSGLFVPESFLTAVAQATAVRNEWPLEHTMIQTEVTKKRHTEIGASARDGAYVHGLDLEGARWDDRAACLEESRPKELTCAMPVLLLKAINTQMHSPESDAGDAYACPVYRTQQRGVTKVFMASLRTKAPPAKWTLSGTALILECE